MVVSFLLLRQGVVYFMHERGIGFIQYYSNADYMIEEEGLP